MSSLRKSEQRCFILFGRKPLHGSPCLRHRKHQGCDCTSRSRVATTSSRGTLVSISYPAARRNSGSTLPTKLSTRATSSGRLPYWLVVLLHNRSTMTSTHWENSSPSASTALYPRAASLRITVDLPVPDIPVKRIRFMTPSPRCSSKTHQPDQTRWHGRSLIGGDIPVLENSGYISILRGNGKPGKGFRPKRMKYNVNKATMRFGSYPT